MSAPQPPAAADTRARFLASIVEVVPEERLAEIHFFVPIRQGPIETGVAVIGAEREGAAVAVAEGEHAASDESGQPSPDRRHVVFMARYRWTRKGPERGKWASEVVAEADAPLVTVEAVAQGVRQRSADESEPDRMTGDEARAILAEARARNGETDARTRGVEADARTRGAEADARARGAEAEARK